MLSLSINEKRTKVFLSTHSPEYVNYYNNLISLGLIDIVIYYGKEKGTRINGKDSIIKEIESYFLSLFSENDLTILDISDVFVCSDNTNNFLIFAKNHNLKCSVVELEPNQFDNKSRNTIACRLGWVSKDYSDLQLQTGLFDASSNCKQRYRAKGSNLLPNDLLLDPINEIKKNIIFSKKVLQAFELSDHLGVLPQLVVMNSGTLGNRLRYPDEDVKFLYQLLIDKFGLSSHTLIKIHPHDSNIYHSDTFINSTILGYFPLELYCLYDNLIIDTIISINTTATKKLERFVTIHNNLAFPAFFSYYYIFNQLVVVCDILNKMPYRVVIHQDICETLMINSLLKNNDNYTKSIAVKMVLDIELNSGNIQEYCSNYDCLIILCNKTDFTSSLSSFSVVESDNSGTVICFKISIHRSSDHSLAYDHDEYFLIYSKMELTNLYNLSTLEHWSNAKFDAQTSFLWKKKLSEIGDVVTIKYPVADKKLVDYISTVRFKQFDFYEYDLDIIDYYVGQGNIDLALRWAMVISSTPSPALLIRIVKLCMIRNMLDDLNCAYDIINTNITKCNKVLLLKAELLLFIKGDMDPTIINLLNQSKKCHVMWRFMDIYRECYTHHMLFNLDLLKRLYSSINE